MIIVKGSKKEEINERGFESLSKNFDSVVLDIGTGDGKFVYKSALKDKNTLFIGMDPVERQLRTYSKKSNRKRLENALFVLGSIDSIPPELFSRIDKIYINLPWGTLLENVAKGNEDFVEKVYALLKKGGLLEIIFGYLPELEPSETKRLNLPDISRDKSVDQIMLSFKIHFEIEEIRKLDKKDMGNIETTWAKKLKHGNDRNIYKMVFRKKS
jgi:16S rRNA (adenine(1408)-N(1))-methyltransferase